ncbi:MAG: hypothetical protein ACPGEF_07065 [Endozoicomonas sp.]
MPTAVQSPTGAPHGASSHAPTDPAQSTDSATSGKNSNVSSATDRTTRSVVDPSITDNLRAQHGSHPGDTPLPSLIDRNAELAPHQKATNIPNDANSSLEEEARLMEDGEKALTAAQEAFKTHAQVSLCKNAIEELNKFINVCNDSYNTPQKLVAALKAIKLSPEAQKNKLNVNIQEGLNTNQHLPSLSLIPPDEANLLNLPTCKEILDKYTQGLKGMQQWKEKNKNLGTVEDALLKLNKSLDVLKEIKKLIDKKQKERTGSPGNCHLEYQYQQYTEAHRVTISETIDLDTVNALGADDIDQTPQLTQAAESALQPEQQTVTEAD